MSARVLSKILPFSLSFLSSAVLLAQQSSPDLAIDEAGSVFAQGKSSEAEQKLDTVLKSYPDDLRALLLKGAILDSEQRYSEAASYYQRALRIAPHSAQVLNNVANHFLSTGDLVQARKFYLETIAIQPNHVNANLQLVQMSVDDKQGQQALAYLSRVENFANAEPGMVVLRARALALIGHCPETTRLLTSLEDQPSAGPNMYFSAGMAFAQCKLYDQAEKSFSRALDAEPTNFDVLYNLGLASFEAGHWDRAAGVLQTALKERPEDTDCLYALAQVYLNQDRLVDAAALLVKAQRLTPDRADVALLLAQVSARLEFFKDAVAEYDKYLKLKPADAAARGERGSALLRSKQVGAMDEARAPEVGLIEYLSLSPVNRRAIYLAKLRKNAAENPGDLHWKMRLGRELLSEGKTSEGLDTFRQIRAASSEPALLAECGRILLNFEQYDMALQFLQAAVAGEPGLSAARLDLAIVRLHLQTPQIALAELDQTPPDDRKGDYYLLRAQILDLLGKMEEAVDALNRGIRAAPTRSDLYLQSAGFLIKHNLLHEALDLLDQASRVLPDDRELLLAQAVTLQLLRREMEAQALLSKIQAHWPEWNRAYVLSGILLEMQLKSAEARQTLESAIALGANTPELYYYETLAIMHTSPGDIDSAERAIDHALVLTSKDPYIFLLAGKISLAKKDYSTAIQQLLQAIRLQPALIPAHYALRDAYKALGDERQSAAEMEQIKRIVREGAPDHPNPFSMEGFLFGVRPPG